MSKTIYAIAVFDDSKIKGTVLFSQEPNKDVRVEINLEGLGKNRKRGFPQL